jgi:ERCC4-type nuclease
MDNPDQRILRRYDRKPKRAPSRKLYLLQGLPGVGPALANRLLIEFRSVRLALREDDRFEFANGYYPFPDTLFGNGLAE